MVLVEFVNPSFFQTFTKFPLIKSFVNYICSLEMRLAKSAKIIPPFLKKGRETLLQVECVFILKALFCSFFYFTAKRRI